MTPWPFERLAALHARCFPAHPRPWSAAEFAALTASPGAFLLTEPDGFLLGRAAGGEAELLTLAVAPEARRRGIARSLVSRFADAARDAGAKALFLEVAADNAPAIALYRGTGWTEAGRRRGYYAPGVDALVMTHRPTAQEH